MKLSSLPIDVQSLVRGAMIVGEGRAYNDWIEGVKQDSGGYAYDVLFPEVDYEKSPLKVAGEQKPSIPYNGKPIPVVLEGVTAKAYQNFKTGRIELSIYAEKISVERQNIKMNRGGDNE